jgi:hypothetical protein
MLAAASCRKSPSDADRRPAGQNSPAPYQAAEEPNNLHIDEFGIDEGNSIDSGFFFFDGNYIDAPYKVTRKGIAVFINDIMVHKDYDWPPRKDVRVEKDPGIPLGLTTTSAFKDIDDGNDPFNSPAGRKFRYLIQHFPHDVVVEEMIKWFRSLPFVKSAERRQPGSSSIVVRTKEGEEKIYPIIMPTGSVVVIIREKTRADVLKELAYAKSRFEERLKKGDCFFLYSKGGELSFGAVKVCKDLGLVVEVLRSKRTSEEKAALLERLSVLPQRKKAVSEPLLTNFKDSRQLEDRINAIVKSSGVKPTTWDEVPIIPPAIEHELRAARESRARIGDSLKNEKDPKKIAKLQNRLQWEEGQIKQLEKQVEHYKQIK